jgi:hypothetical protein
MSAREESKDTKECVGILDDEFASSLSVFEDAREAR